MRTQGAAQVADDATRWLAVQVSSLAVPALSSWPSGARATVPAPERCCTTAEVIRERATEGWHGSTLTMKEG